MGNCFNCFGRRSKNENIGPTFKNEITLFRELSNAEKQQERKDLEVFHWKTMEMIAKAVDTVRSLRVAADYLDEVWMDCKIARVSGISAGIVGGVLTIGGVMTAGASTPLLIAGLGIGAAGAGTNVITSFVKATINSSVIKKAEKDLEDTLDNVNNVNGVIQEWLHKKEMAKLYYICQLALRTLDFSDHARKILQQVVLPVLISSVSIVKAGETVIKAGQACAQGAGNAGIRAGMVGSGGVAKAGVKAGSKAAAKRMGGLIIGVSAVFLVLDVIHLGFTIRDIIEEKGSGAAKMLRQKADQIEQGILKQ